MYISFLRLQFAAAVSMSVAACGGDSIGPTLVPTYTVGGTVAGLVAGESVTLQNNESDALTIDQNASFTFTTAVKQGAGYAVTVETQPPGQSCAVANATGSAMANVTDISVTCTNLPQYAYVVNNGSNTLSQYSIAANGALVPLTPAAVATGPTPESVTVDPTHHYVYVTNLTDDTVSQYIIQANGTLMANNPATVAAGHGPRALAVSTAGFAYVVNGTDQTVSLYTVGHTGLLEPSATAPVATGITPWNITLAPNGKFAYVSAHGTTAAPGDTVNQYAVASATGALTPLDPGAAAAGTYPSGDALDATSAFAYVTDLGANGVSQFAVGDDGTLKSLTPAMVPAGSEPVYIAIDPSNRYAYVANFTPAVAGATPPGTVSQYARSASGALTPMTVPSVDTGGGPTWVAFDPFGKFVYVPNSAGMSVSEFAIGVGGALTLLGTVGANQHPFAVATTYIGS